MHNSIPHPRSTHVAYFRWTLLHEKSEIHKKHDCNHVFSCISHFSRSRVHRKYATWVLPRWGIKFWIQWVLSLEIWVKNLGDKLKIRVEKVVLLFYYFLIFLPFYIKDGKSSPMVDIIILNPIGSYKFYFGCTIFLGGTFYNSKFPYWTINFFLKMREVLFLWHVMKAYLLHFSL